MRKEIKIFFIVFVIAAIGMHHQEFASHPLEHILHLPNSGVYGIGFIHPLVFTLIIYLVLWIPRGVIRFFRK